MTYFGLLGAPGKGFSQDSFHIDLGWLVVMRGGFHWVLPEVGHNPLGVIGGDIWPDIGFVEGFAGLGHPSPTMYVC